jgi:hypothetical protein
MRALGRGPATARIFDVTIRYSERYSVPPLGNNLTPNPLSASGDLMRLRRSTLDEGVGRGGPSVISIGWARTFMAEGARGR